MAEKESYQPTHKAFSVIYWINIGAAFPHKGGRGFTVRLQAFPLDGKIVCREIAEGEQPNENVTPLRSPQPDRQGGTGRGKR